MTCACKKWAPPWYYPAAYDLLFLAWIAFAVFRGSEIGPLAAFIGFLFALYINKCKMTLSPWSLAALAFAWWLGVEWLLLQLFDVLDPSLNNKGAFITTRKITDATIFAFVVSHWWLVHYGAKMFWPWLFRHLGIAENRQTASLLTTEQNPINSVIYSVNGVMNSLMILVFVAVVIALSQGILYEWSQMGHGEVRAFLPMMWKMHPRPIFDELLGGTGLLLTLRTIDRVIVHLFPAADKLFCPPNK